MTTYVITFETTHAAMAASNALTEAGLRFETIPVPTSISAGCGIALRFRADDPSEVLTCLFGDKHKTDIATLYLQGGHNDFARDGALDSSVE